MKLLTTKEAAAYLGISMSTIYRMCKENKITFIKLGTIIKFREKDLETCISDNTIYQKEVIN